MDDELEDKIIYQTIISHMKLITKLIMGISVHSTYINHYWRMMRLYFFRPEIILFSLFVLFCLTYLPSVDLRAKSILKKIGFSIGEPVLLRSVTQQQSQNDDLSWEYKNGNVAVFSIQGRRPHMEDRFVVRESIEETGVSLFAVFDGHGGDFAAEYAAKHLIDKLKTRVIEIKQLIKDGKTISKSSINGLIANDSPVEANTMKKKLNKIMSQTDDQLTSQKNTSALDSEIQQRLDKILPISREVKISKSTHSAPVPNPEEYLQRNGNINYNKLLTDEVLLVDKDLVEAAKKKLDIAGTTALVALIEKNQLIVANVGDSRGVMCDSKGNAIPLSFDHKPQQMREKKRIQEAGGFISFNGVWRVAGILATSRALGDYPLKDRNLVIANPDILTFDLSDHKPQFLMFASDGLWDIFSNEEAVAFVKERLNESFFGAKSITWQAYHKGSLDNITVLVINLDKHNWANNSSNEVIRTS